jgi:alkylhydroperoxidase family enzyme
MRHRKLLALLALCLSFNTVWGDDGLEGVRPTPLTRPEMKKLLEEVKQRTPRIPLPELTEAEKKSDDPRATGYENRVRQLYTNGIDASRFFGFRDPNARPNTPNPNSGTPAAASNSGSPNNRSQDPLFTLSDELKVELFWIVSRVNNCHYCIGHQESKLLRLGLSDDKIASLDFDWTAFDKASQTAFAFGKTFTLDPHLLSDGDIAGLKEHFNDNQILEMILSMAGNNSINRWKEAIGVPQHADGGGFSPVGRQEAPVADNLPKGSYETPTSPSIEKKTSKIVVTSETSERSNTCATVSRRPALESRDVVEKKLEACKARAPRIPLLDEETTRANLPAMAKVPGPLPNYARLLARFPTAGSSRVDGILAAFEKGDLTPKLRWQLAWILARQDRAWYVLDMARKQLLAMGQSADEIYALDGDWASFAKRDQVLFRLAKKLGTSPVTLNATDVKEAVDTAGPRDTVQVISFTTGMSSFNRITEAIGLPLDETVYPRVASRVPDAVPLTRDDVKRTLDASKQTLSRLPPPPLTEEERQLIAKQKEQEKATGETPRRFGLANNARTRAYYLSEYGFSIKSDIERAVTNAQRESDTGLDPSFRIMMFWIVSRGNNCTYCLGHQESGLAHRGVPEEVRAALDSDWSEFEPSKRAAFEFTTKASFQPHLIKSSDVDALRKFYNDKQVAEILVTVAGFNATNRWTGPMRIQQDVLYDFSTPTAAKFASRASLVAPYSDYPTPESIVSRIRERPELEDWKTVQERLKEAKSRTALLPLADVDATQKLLQEKALDVSLADRNWVRFLATVPKSGMERISAHHLAQDHGTLEARAKAIIAYTAARQDRAWYAVGQAIDRLRSLGFQDEEIQKLDNPNQLPRHDAIVVQFANQITTNPALVSDQDFASMQSIMTDKQVAEAVYMTTLAAFLNRVTEIAQLPLEQ